MNDAFHVEYRVLHNEPDPHAVTGDRPWVAYEGDDWEEAKRIFEDVKLDSERAGLHWNVQLQQHHVTAWVTVEALLSAETVEEAMEGEG